jgi:hypothetical protein
VRSLLPWEEEGRDREEGGRKGAQAVTCRWWSGKIVMQIVILCDRRFWTELFIVILLSRFSLWRSLMTANGFEASCRFFLLELCWPGLWRNCCDIRMTC